MKLYAETPVWRARQRACDDPAAALAAGDDAPLAAVELGARGLRVPGAGASHV